MTSEIFKSAKRLYTLGFAIHWLHPKSKRPVEAGWTSGPRKPWEYLKETYFDGLNSGTRLGSASPINGGYLAVIDVDIKSNDETHRLEAVTAAKKLLKGKKAPIVKSGRGMGSRHYYVLTREPFKTATPFRSTEEIKIHQPSKKPSKYELTNLTKVEIASGIRLSHAWEVSLYSEGRQVVLPPSIHPDTGKPYMWFKHIACIDDLPFVDFREALNLVIQDSASKKESTTPRTREDDSGFEFEPVEVDIEWLPISDKMREGILHGSGVSDRSGFLLPACNALLSAGLNQSEVLSVLTDDTTFLGACAFDHAKTKDRKRAAAWVYRYTFRKIKSEQTPSDLFVDLEDVPVRTLSPEEAEEWALELLGDDWRLSLDRAKNKTAMTLKNLDLIFTHSVEGPPFVRDLFANRIIYGANTPWGGKSEASLEDIDLVLVKRWLGDTEFAIEPNTNAILEATSLIAHRMAIHPVREYLEGLEWDGVSRIDTWLKDYCQAEAPEPYLSEVSRKFLLAMVKRVFEPGCQWDYVLVLEGKQGKYKSSIARAIAGDKWFMDNLPDLKDKDAMLNLQGKWLIELAELANVKRADYNLVKAYLIRRYDTVRPHYGRLMADVPRQSVFIGTVNEGQYLKDPTGNRRFWPVLVHDCDVEGLKKVRDQLFAEAYHIYKTTDEILMLSPEASAQAVHSQEDRKVEDDVSEMKDALRAFIDSAEGERALGPKKDEKDRTFSFCDFKSRELFESPSMPWFRWSTHRYGPQLASEVLQNMGFKKGRKEDRRFWFLPTVLHQENEVKKQVLSDPPDRPKNGSVRGLTAKSAKISEITFI